VNRKTMKKINRQVKIISVEWLQSIMPEGEADKINLKNFRQYLNQTSHYFKNKQFFNSAFTERWTRNKLKDFYNKNPYKPIDSYTVADLK
jgi:type III secretory pathway component EscR